jgi:addiction module RelE/StbE family toxin
MYSLEIESSCREFVKKRCKKDKLLKVALTEKVEQILAAPYSFKPLHSPLENMRRVHIGSFVLIYTIDEKRKVVRLLKFAHHDEAYH